MPGSTFMAHEVRNIEENKAAALSRGLLIFVFDQKNKKYMEKIIEYQAIKSQSISKLTKNVSSQIDDGWQPFGGISSAPTSYEDENLEKSDTVMFSQAMVKYAKG